LKLKQYILGWILKRLKIPVSALRMFKASNDISGINKSTLPTELIPLNSIQLSRGLLNFVVFQSNPKWILPYWSYVPNEFQINFIEINSPQIITETHKLIANSSIVTHRNIHLVKQDIHPQEELKAAS